jgi:ABC-type multidrug transport system fused ATPase/permease subunit
MIFYFAEIFEDISRSTEDEDFMETIRSMVYAFLVLGVVISISMTLQNFIMESAAETMTHHLQNDWFRALLRQDMAYYDIKDVAGEASILSSNAKRYHCKHFVAEAEEACSFYRKLTRSRVQWGSVENWPNRSNTL